jgi:hypothetical protein
MSTPDTAPFWWNGSLIRHPVKPRGTRGSRMEWRDNTPFRLASLKIVEERQEKSGAWISIWEDDQGSYFPMTMTDLVDLIKNQDIVDGEVIDENWIIKSHVPNWFSIALAPEEAS